MLLIRCLGEIVLDAQGGISFAFARLGGPDPLKTNATDTVSASVAATKCEQQPNELRVAATRRSLYPLS
jgi:hypothetical protein